jgi:acyl transferase domain-containing protein
VLAGLGQFLQARWKPADRRRLLVAVAGNASRLRELADDLVALIDQQTEAQRVKDTGVIS